MKNFKSFKLNEKNTKEYVYKSGRNTVVFSNSIDSRGDLGVKIVINDKEPSVIIDAEDLDDLLKFIG